MLTINASNESNNGGYDSPIAQPSKNMTKYHSQKIYSSNFDENETKSEMQQI